ncbi:RNA polymerase sigma factor [Actinoplanes sp. L3-i22]|uniref:RNA polymerase sigma factor n=1 Tax=Actinoplanes sp. L3-i22 TaxID=2836373 RepID=UPI002102CA81|nr:sigma-70 family RNA polymerase sigma factor [Actinoplanes sp. L3-i22]
MLPRPWSLPLWRRGTTSGPVATATTGASAIHELYRERRLPLVRMAVLMVDDLPTAEDVVQDVFTRLYRRHGTGLDALDDPSAYLVSAVMNAARSVLRRRRISRAYLPPRPDPAPAAEDEALLGAGDREVIRALRRLTTRQRQVIVLRYWSGLSEREIAGALRITAGTVKSTAHRALTLLRAELGES